MAFDFYLIALLVLSHCDFSFVLGCGYLFFEGGVQLPPAGSCNFGVLEGEDEHTSFYSTELMFF